MAKLAPTAKGRDFISGPDYGGILRETLQSCLDAELSYNYTYLVWVCKTASYLAGRFPAHAIVRGTGEMFAFATPELQAFANEQRETIEEALAPYIEELDAAPLRVLNEAEFVQEIENMRIPVDALFKRAKAGK